MGSGSYNSEDEDEQLFKDLERSVLNRDDPEFCHVYSILKHGQLTIFGGPDAHLESEATRVFFRDANIPYFEVNEIEVPDFSQPEFRSVITQVCGIGKLPAIFFGYKYVGGLEEIKELK